MSAENDDSKTADESIPFPNIQLVENGEGASLTPENEVEAPSTQQNETEADGPPESAHNGKCCGVLVQTPSPPSKIVSPRPSPHFPGRSLITAAVEDWEEDDSHDHPDYTPPSSFCVTTPPVIEASLSPGVQDKIIKAVKSETYLQDHRDESRRRPVDSSDMSFQQTAQQNTSRRRPSVMDYLVSHGPVKYPMSTSRASSPTSRRVVSEGQLWQGHDRIPTHGGQPYVYPSYQGDDRRQQIGWAAQQPPFRFGEKTLNVDEDHGSEVSHRRGFNQPWEHHGPAAPSSNISVSNSDDRADVFTGAVYPEFVNRLDNMAPSGYHLLATKLSGDSCGQPITPIYRRFDALNHRLLLYMQDEIADLERQLIVLEAKDTVKRSYAGGVIPASRRQDRWINGSLADQKTEILGLIGYKLSQYNQVLASFCKVQVIPAPTWRDVDMYKTYLTTSKLIVDDETRFLDASNDLISLNTPSQPVDDFNRAADGPTPMPKTAEDQQSDSFFKDNGISPSTRLDQDTTAKPDDALFVRLALSGTCIVIVPITIFSVIPSLIGRMAIVLLVALSVSIMVDQSGLFSGAERHKRDWIVYLGLYCGAMAVVAGAMK
ncbi:hypothetical protein C2857_001417 [Epichloe festucae Fl1]|uniref:DUF6594 domain-containing protein n=1 Tax=Epichloe festucae (strain Fl1) TaxID=877507 RepID=A0A7S9KJS3_EPIFF|nr:hypothetical protein C2857_001417 [Epichloe festucae Fl1]